MRCHSFNNLLTVQACFDILFILTGVPGKFFIVSFNSRHDKKYLEKVSSSSEKEGQSSSKCNSIFFSKEFLKDKSFFRQRP